jgi:pantetheine-phosphate adenylyltransferase
MNKNGLVIGSFDPLTLGHENLIKVASTLVDKLYVLVSNNVDKKNLLNDYFKEKIIVNFIKTNNLNNVEFIGFNEKEFSLNYVKKYNVSILFRGVRDSTDFLYEENLRYFNTDIDSSVQTIYIPSLRNQEKVSSTAVRNFMKYNDWENLISKYVSSDVFVVLKNLEKYNQLFKYWSNVISVDKIEEKWFNYIFDKYSEPHRFYHSVDHLLFLLKQITQLKFYKMQNKMNNEEFDDNCLIFTLFCFFHDIEYTIGSKSNEDDSVKVFKDYAKNVSIDSNIKNKVIEAILLTKNHKLKSNEWIVNFCLDCDLMILLAEEEKFQTYCEQIRKEYAIFPDDVYNVKRIEFLSDMLDVYPFVCSRLHDDTLKHRYKTNINNAILALGDKKY